MDIFIIEIWKEDSRYRNAYDLGYIPLVLKLNILWLLLPHTPLYETHEEYHNPKRMPYLS